MAVHGAYGVVADRAEFADAHTVVRARATSPRSSSPLPSNLPKSPFWFTPSRSLTVSSSLLPPARPQVTSVGNALRFQDTSSSTSRFLWGVGRAISCFAVSVEGGLVAYAESGSRDPTIRVHALDTLAPVASLEGCASSAVTALAFSRDGRFLAAASALPDLALTLRDARAGDPVVRTRLSSEAASIAFNPFDAHELLVTHVPAGVLSPHPGVTLHVVRHSHGEPPAVRARELRVDAVGVAPAAIVAAAWSPERTVYLGTDAGALLVVHRTPATSSHHRRASPNPSPRTFARAGSAFEGPRAPDGASLAWAVVPGGAPARGSRLPRRASRSRAGGTARCAFHAHARTRRRAVETEIPARLVKTLGVSGGEGDGRQRRFFLRRLNPPSSSRGDAASTSSRVSWTKTDPSPNASARGWRRSERRRRRRRRGRRGWRGFPTGPDRDDGRRASASTTKARRRARRRSSTGGWRRAAWTEPSADGTYTTRRRRRRGFDASRRRTPRWRRARIRGDPQSSPSRPPSASSESSTRAEVRREAPSRASPSARDCPPPRRTRSR